MGLDTVEQFAQLLYELRAKSASLLKYDEVLLQLQQMTPKVFAIPIERVVPKASFVKDLGLN